MNKLFSKIKIEDLIFDLIIAVAAIFIQGIMTTLDFMKLPAAVFIILAFLSVVSLSYKMGNFFVIYRAYKGRGVKLNKWTWRAMDGTHN